MIDYFEIIGIIGLVIILIAFALNHWKKVTVNGFRYNAGNFVGSIMLGTYANQIGSIPFLVLQFAWAGIALYFLIKRVNELKGKRKKWRD